MTATNQQIRDYVISTTGDHTVINNTGRLFTRPLVESRYYIGITIGTFEFMVLHSNHFSFQQSIEFREF